MYFNRVAIMYAFYFELHSLDIISKRLYPFVLGKFIKTHSEISRLLNIITHQEFLKLSDNKDITTVQITRVCQSRDIKAII